MSKNDKIVIGERIKMIRQEKKISQDRLSKLADLSLNTIVNLETDKNANPTVDTVLKISKALGVDINRLLK